MQQSAALSRPLSTKMNQKVEGDEPEEKETLTEFIGEHLDKFFVDHIPVESIKDLDKTYMYYFGTVAHLMAIFLFVVFTYQNYYSQVSQAFIALSTSDGSGCQPVSIAVTGSYLADNQGIWVGSPKFVDSKSLYSLSFSNFKINSITQYAQMMATFQQSLDVIGEISVHQNLPENLLFWMSFVQFYSVSDPTATDFAQIGYGQLQSMELTGNPQNVFDLEYVSGAVGSVSGTCSASSLSSFDQANSQLTATYRNYTQFVEDPVCAAAVFPQSFGYVGRLDDNTYTMRLDARSFSTAMAVNYGVLPVTTLKVVDYNVKSFSFEGVRYDIGQYYDVRYSLMDTVTCMVNTTTLPTDSPHYLYQHLCFYVVGETFALPVFNHYGANPVQPEYCDCTLPVGSSQNCQEFNLLSGLVFYRFVGNSSGIVRGALDTDLRDLGLFSLLSLLGGFPTYRDFNRAAYNASFITSASSYVPDETQLKEAYAFCHVESTNQSCSLLTFNSFQVTSYEVSDYKYQVFNGSCKNSTSIPPLAWSNLVNNPPVAFTQTYFECFDSPQSSFINAIGIASGNVQIFIPFLVFALLPFLYGLLVLIRQVPPKPEYSNEEQEQALRIFSMLMLRLRDGKTRGIRPRGVLMGLTKEIISAAKEEGGYPDSDDEDEEDESRASGRESSGRKHSTHRPIRKLRSSSLNSADSSIADLSTLAAEYTEYNRQSTATGGWATSPRKSSIAQRSHGAQHRVSTVQAGHQPGRTKMGVFTKHIAERNAKLVQQQRQLSTDSNHGERQVSVANYLNPFASRGPSFAFNANNRSPYGAGGSKHIRSTLSGQTGGRGDLEAGDKALNDDTYVGSSSATSNSATRRRSTMLGYLFGGDEQPQPSERASELVAHQSPPAYIDLTLQTVPSGVRIMNLADEFSGGSDARRQTMRKPLSGKEVDLLVDDLLRLFGETLASLARSSSISIGVNPMHSPSNNGTKSSTIGTLIGEEEAQGGDRSESVVSVSGGEETTRDSFSFVQGRALSVKLSQILFDELMEREDKTVFLRLSNALCMQASIELRCEMRHVMQKFGDRIAYNIGGRMLTAANLDAIL